MKTEELIAALAADTAPMPRGWVARRLALGLGAGALVTLALVATGIGLRVDLPDAVHGFPFWMKWTYTISLAVAASVAVARLARPEPIDLRRFWPVGVPFLLLAGVALLELAHRPTSEWLAMWLGKTWTKCPWLVLALSAPIFAGLLWAFRRLAPTRLRAAGAAAGLAAGAWGATLYCLHCPETSALFVLTWYTLGMALAAAIGALVGPRLMRW